MMKKQLLWVLLVTMLVVSFAGGALATDSGNGVLSATAVLDANAHVFLTWEMANGPAPVDILWSKDPANAKSGEVLASGIEKNTYYFEAPAEGQVYYYVKTQDGQGIETAIRKIYGFDNEAKMDVFAPVNNFRDFGGYETADGNYVQWGRLYRSNALYRIDEAEVAMLAELGLTHIIDLRSASDAKNKPDPQIGGAVMVYYDAPTDETPEVDPKSLEEQFSWLASYADEPSDSDEAEDDGSMVAYMIAMVEGYKDLYTETLNILADHPNAVILSHCAGGKDRTGAFCAVVLHALGVDKETIIEDYMLTAPYRLPEDLKEYEVAMEIAGLSGEAAERAWEAWATERTFIEAFFDAVDEAYGSMDNYIEEGLGISEETLAKIRTNLYQ